MKPPTPVALIFLYVLAVPLLAQNIQPSYDLAKTVGSDADAPHLRGFGATSQAHLGSGSLVADINNDGVDDLIVAANNANIGSPVRTAAGALYVWFGGATFGGENDLATTTADLTIFGASPNDMMTHHGPSGVGKPSMNAGDVNGDGKDDLIIASPLASGPGDSRPYAGEVYVIFGRAVFPAALDMAVQGAGGADVTLYGASSATGDPYNTADKLGDRGALVVADVNGDGMADMLLGAPNAAGPGEAFPGAGEAYIVFGRTVFPPTLDMAVQGAGGADVTIYGQHRALPHPSHIDLLTEQGKIAAGDINGDGITDIVLGARSEGPDGLRIHSGKYYVVFGRQSPATFPSTITLAATTGDRADVVIYGANENDAFNAQFGLTLGDVSGDGVADILMTAPYGNGPGETRNIAGEVYIVLGRTSPETFPAVIDLAVQGVGGADVTIYGASEQDQLGGELNLHVVDMNADGIGDLILGALYGDGPAEDRPDAGEAYIIFGRASFPAMLDLAVRGAGGAGVTFYGTGRPAVGFNPFVGEALAAGEGIASGDLNGDGVADLVLGAPNGFRDGVGYTGRAYVVFGQQSPSVFPATLDFADPASANVTVIGAPYTAGFGIGYRNPVFGDFNDDDVPDLAIGSDNPAGVPNQRKGAAYVVFGTIERPASAIEPVVRLLPGSTPAHLFIEITARVGQVVTLQDSTDLAAWPDLETLTLDASTITIELQTIAPTSQRFLRAQWTETP